MSIQDGHRWPQCLDGLPRQDGVPVPAHSLRVATSGGAPEFDFAVVNRAAQLLFDLTYRCVICGHPCPPEDHWAVAIEVTDQRYLVDGGAVVFSDERKSPGPNVQPWIVNHAEAIGHRACLTAGMGVCPFLHDGHRSTARSPGVVGGKGIQPGDASGPKYIGRVECRVILDPDSPAVGGRAMYWSVSQVTYRPLTPFHPVMDAVPTVVPDPVILELMMLNPAEVDLLTEALHRAVYQGMPYRKVSSLSPTLNAFASEAVATGPAFVMSRRDQDQQLRRWHESHLPGLDRHRPTLITPGLMKDLTKTAARRFGLRQATPEAMLSLGPVLQEMLWEHDLGVWADRGSFHPYMEESAENRRAGQGIMVSEFEWPSYLPGGRSPRPIMVYTPPDWAVVVFGYFDEIVRAKLKTWREVTGVSLRGKWEEPDPASSDPSGGGHAAWLPAREEIRDIGLFQASDVPGLRQEVVEFYGSPRGSSYFLQALKLGRQFLRPPIPDEAAAEELARAETARLRDGDLWYVDEDLCALLNAAYPTMPTFAPMPTDLPSQAAFVVFAEPIAVRTSDDGSAEAVAQRLGVASDDLQAELERVGGERTQVVAVSWGPMPAWIHAGSDYPAGGLWMSFYCDQTRFRAGLRSDSTTAAQRRLTAYLPSLAVDNEAVVPWRPDGAPIGPYQFPDDQPDSVVNWARFVFAAFQLASQTNLAQVDHRRIDRAERRRARRANHAIPDVRVVQLRSSIADERDSERAGGTRDWRHRWIVRGHWRQQWYPSQQDRRPIWIAPYLKGPTDAPLLGGERVNLVTGPPPAPDAPSLPD